MADSKITALSALSLSDPADVVPIVDDPAGSPVTKKIAVADLMAGWDKYIVKSADQDVTNNATVQNDSELKFAVVSGEVWYVELLLVYSGNNTTGDYKLDWGLPTATGTWSYLGVNTTADAILVSTGIRMAAITALAAQVSLGTTANLTDKRVFQGWLMFTAGSSADLQFKFANNSASSGRTSRTCAGSVLRAIKLA